MKHRILVILSFILFSCVSHAWQPLMPEPRNDFEKKQNALIGLSGFAEKFSLTKDEKLTITFRSDIESELETITIKGQDSAQVEVFIYNYPGYFKKSERDITELAIRTTEKTTSHLFYQPRSYESTEARIPLNKNQYIKEFKQGSDTIFYLEVNLSIEKSDRDRTPHH